MIDLLICSVPSGIINRPPAAPALLKACAMSAGYSVKTIDFSLMFYTTHCKSNYDEYYQLNRLFEALVPWENHLLISTWLDDCVDTIASIDPKFLAISVFSTHQHRATLLLCEKIKKEIPKLKIILGGYGLPEPCQSTFKNFKCLSGREKLMNFSEYIKSRNLADYFVFEEGEQKLVDILDGRVQTSDYVELNDVPFGNFDDYQLDQYLWHTEPVLSVTGSKGCVRKCTFCNVPEKFGRYRRKSGKRIAEEMISLSKQYNVRKFEFTDSLVNGSLKDFEEFISVLAKYNSTSVSPITWYGQYICRPQSQIPKGMYQLIKQSGAVNLIIGAESGSNAVLEAMNKKITVQDIFDELDQFEKHGLQCHFLVMGSFYNETWDRFLETLEFIARCHRYVAAGVLSRIAVGQPLIIEPNGYLHTHAEELGILIDEKNFSNWTVKNDPTNTWLERIRRRLIMQAVLQSMKVSMTGNGIIQLRSMNEQLRIYEQQLRSPNSQIDNGLFEPGPH